MKRLSLSRFLSLPSLIGGSALLVACAGDPVYVACPQITAPQEGTAAFMKMDDTGELIDVRLNGVRGLCQNLDNGGTLVDVSVGLKLKRAARDDMPAGVAEVEMIGFIVDADDKVVSSDTIRYKTGFAKDVRTNYPLAEYSVVLVDGQRLVLSLVPAL
ncbi:MAG: hypothetical protein ACON31_11370 [Candidatus Puniceispirillaceae bacterium]